MHRIDLSFLGRFGLAVCAFGLSALSASAAAPSLSSPTDNATIATLNAAHKAYYAKSLAQRRAIDDAGWSANRWSLITNATCFPQKTTFSWTGTAPFRLKICRAADQSVFFETNGLTAKSFAVGNFEIGTSYQWAVSNATGISAWRTFTTESEGPRLLDGASEYVQEYYEDKPSYHFSTPTPQGVRDLGGYTGLDRRRSRQGLLIRSSQLDGESNEGATNHITNTNRKFWKEFIPVKTEIDLRTSDETEIKNSPLGTDVTYMRKPISAWARYFGSGSSSNAKIRDIVNWCADSSHYPIVFHCVHGKDRTGALALILGGLLGYEYDTMAKDYEATMFWNPGQGSAGYFELAEYFRTNTWANTSAPVTVNEGIYNYVLKTGVSAETIDKFRNIMLEPKSEPTHTHSWSGWSISAEPTVSATGTKRRTCSGCDEVETETLAKLPNRYDWLKTDGKGYILTDYTPNLQKTCIETTFTLLSATDGALWTANKSTLPSGTGCGAQTLLNYDGSRFLYFNQPTDDDVYRSFADGLVGLNDSHVIVTHGQTVDMDGARVVASIEGYTENDKAASGPLMLAAGNYCSEKRHEVVPTAVKLHTLRVREVEGGVTNLVRVYVPCTNASGAATFWDVWNGTYCTVLVNGTGTAAFEVGNGAPTPPEPEPEVETFDWLQTDGNGYILTDYTPNLRKTRIEVVYEQTSQDDGFLWMANDCTQPGGKDSGVQTCLTANGLGAMAGYELMYCNQPAGVSEDIQVSYGTPQASVVKTNVTQGASAWLNGVRYDLPGDYTPTDARTSGPLVLFAGNWASGYEFKGKWKGKVYALRISEVSDGEPEQLIHDYVPATNELGVATFYDRKTKTYAAVNAGTYAVGNGYPVPPGPGPGPLDPDPTVKPQATWPIEDAIVDILTDDQRTFLSRSATERRELFTNGVYRTDLASRDGGFCDPQPAALTWTGDGMCTVRVWKVSADAAETLHFATNLIAQTVNVDNFEVAQAYRWEVANALGSSGGTFVTRAETPRLLRDPDPQQNIQGIRDLGGRIGEGGRRVRQGRIFRCSEFNYKEPAHETPDQPGESFVNDLNRDWWLNTLRIKTDLDLRSDDQTQNMTGSPLGETVAWQHISAGSYTGLVASPAAFKACFRLFLNETNYPVAIHCVAGQDRTGCLAFVLEALLGVDDDECMKDWEANAFRLADPDWNHANGIDLFVACFNGQPGATLKDRITAWVLTQGFTQSDLETFRSIMLESGESPKPEVTRFDWLKTDGVGYIPTDYMPKTAKTRMEMRLALTSVDSKSGLAIANRGTAGKTSGTDAEWGACYFSANLKKSTESYFQYFTEPGEASASFATGFSDTNSVHTVVVGAGITALDGVTNMIATAADDKTAAGPMTLFAANWGETSYDSTARAKVRCYSIRIWEIDGEVETLKHEYVAATNAAGVATLYDTKTKTFLVPTNGSGFQVGNDVAVGPTVDGVTVPFTQEAMTNPLLVNSSKTIVFPSAEGLSVSGTAVTYGGTTVTYADHYLVSLDGARLVLALDPEKVIPAIAEVSPDVPAFSVGADVVTVGVPFANQRQGLYYALDGYETVDASEPTVRGTPVASGTAQQLGCDKPTPARGFFRMTATDVPPLQE